MGLAVMILGITASETWQTEKLQVMRVGETVDLSDYSFTFRGTDTAEGPNYSTQRGFFDVTRDGVLVAQLMAEQRRYPTPPMTTTEAAIYPMARGDLYAVVGDPDGNGGWSTRLYFKPLVSWIWAGALTMMAGGLLSLADRRHRVGAPSRPRSTRVQSKAIEGTSRP
jgi:cytochrome c-type biogenesis protein CcmF